MPRLFIAVSIPEWIKDELLSLQTNISGAKWTPVNQMHITLKFIGELEGSAFKEVRDVLSNIEFKEFQISLKGVGYFPPSNLRDGRSPKILWAGLDNNIQLTKLRNKIENRLEKLGIKREGRKYIGHITLARLKSSNISRVLEFIKENNTFSTELFQVKEFSLYSSRLYPDGAVHSLEDVYPLVKK